MNKMDARRKQILSLIYMIGLFIFSFLFEKLGAKAGGYLLVIALILVCFFLPFFAFLPVAIEKPLRARLSKGQVKNANGLWKVVIGYSFVTAIVLSVLMGTVVPEFLKNVLGLYNVGFSLPYLAPAFFFLALSRALCMYFQGKGSGLQTVLAAALMIVFSIVFSYVLGKPLAEYGQKVADLLGNVNFREQYLMVGISIGIGIGAFIAFVFLIFAYFISAKEGGRERHSIRMTEHKGDSTRIFVASFFPYFFSTIMMLLPCMLSLVMFFERYNDSSKAIVELGKLTYKQLIPCAVLLLGLLSFVVLIVSQIKGWIRMEEIRQARAGFRIGLVWILIPVGFISVSFVILEMWMVGVLFFAITISYFFATLLWQSGKRKSVLISIFVSMITSMSCSFLISGMLTETGNIIFLPAIVQMGSLFVCTSFFLVKHFRFVPDLSQGFLFPILSSAIAGVIMYILSMVMGNRNTFWGSSLILAIGFVCHLIICLVLQCGNDNEMINLPGGKLWMYIGNRLHLFH